MRFCHRKSAPRKVYTWGVQLSTHDFLLHFCSFFLPLSSGGSVFLPCVLVPGAHETRGGARFFNIFCQIRGAERLLPHFSAKHGGQMGVKYVVPWFFCSGEVFGLFPVAAAGQARKKKEAEEEEEKEEAEDEGGEE